MSWRIEQADPLALLAELPARFAQTCVTRGPQGEALEDALAVLLEIHRVLRDDGTLWLLSQQDKEFLNALAGQGWMRQSLPTFMRTSAESCDPLLRLMLLTKRRTYFCRCHLFYRHMRSPWQQRTARSRLTRRSEQCTRKHESSRELVRRCVLAGTSILACGACGAPYRQARPGEHPPGIRRPTCIHHNPEGRCLVLDPFYQPQNGTAEIADRYGRSFLGITNDRAGEYR